MGQVSSKMRRGTGRYFHYCTACDQLHALPDSWTFDGNLEAPTFQPSFRQMLGARGDCHYNIERGQIIYHGDSHHEYAGKTIPMPDLPAEYSDDWSRIIHNDTTPAGG